jgi:hypothetical protein
MTKTRTTTVTIRPTEKEPPKATTASTGAAAKTAAPPILQAPKAKVSIPKGAARFKEMEVEEKQKHQSHPPSTIEAQPSTVSNATVKLGHLAVPSTSSTRVSPVGNKALGPPTSTFISTVGKTVLDPPTSTPGSLPDHILVDPLPALKAVSETPVPQLVNNKVAVANNTTSTGFQTITRPGTGSKGAGT